MWRLMTICVTIVVVCTSAFLFIDLATMGLPDQLHHPWFGIVGWLCLVNILFLGLSMFAGLAIWAEEDEQDFQRRMNEFKNNRRGNDVQ